MEIIYFQNKMWQTESPSLLFRSKPTIMPPWCSQGDPRRLRRRELSMRIKDEEQDDCRTTKSHQLKKSIRSRPHHLF